MEIGCSLEGRFQKVNLYVLWQTENGYLFQHYLKLWSDVVDNFSREWKLRNSGG